MARPLGLTLPLRAMARPLQPHAGADLQTASLRHLMPASNSVSMVNQIGPSLARPSITSVGKRSCGSNGSDN
jgi:hypothetical protein